ncbi:thiamine diphosphokinase [Oscillospiraceae bacterium MB08-C2-2]|nr:thiamine diphosphokinase [Oscillospiraceae bacterium MB08-C2-2]
MSLSEKDKSLCGVIGAGAIADPQKVAHELSRCGLLLCADGGWAFCRKMGLVPDLLLGDFDSVDEMPKDIPIMTFPVDKNYTDCMLAVEEGAKRGAQHFYLAGTLGGRLDHTLGNLQTLGWCTEKGFEARLDDGVTSVYGIVGGKLTLAPRENHYFSVVPLSGLCRGVTIRGGRFPLESYDLSFSDPRAISNEFAGSVVTVTVEDGIGAVVVTPQLSF